MSVDARSIRFVDWPTGPMTANPRCHDMVIDATGRGEVEGIDTMDDLVQLCRDLDEPIIVYPDGSLKVYNGFNE